MSGRPLLDWAALAVSLFNVVVLAWLGFTVLLNADRRRGGIWVTGGGMLLACGFFVSHAALLALGSGSLSWPALTFWGTLALLAVVTQPFLWYVIILWYTGYWEDPASRLRRRHRYWLALLAWLLVVGLLGVAAAGVAAALLGAADAGQTLLALRPSGRTIPLLALGFAGYILLCTALSLDALRHPGPSARVMGGVARRRAQPWLAGAALALLGVAAIVAGALFWLWPQSRALSLAALLEAAAPVLAVLDLVVALLIALVVVLLGQAIVAYEVFTGKTLPRRGLQRQWQWALVLAASTGAILAAVVVLGVPPVYGLLLAALLVTLFYALSGWRSYVERERLMDALRPFVASQGLYERLLDSANPEGVDLTAPFNALCRDVLDARRATLVPAGSLAALVEKPLVYPPDAGANLPALQALLPRFDSARTEPLAVEPADFGGAQWAIPLWRGRGLAGVLLLGAKQSGGLYAQEEMEIAAITAERLLDTQAGAEMARRLMDLQRRQMVETQVADQQTRRVLHDDILADLHAAIIRLSAGDADGAAGADGALAVLSDTHRQLSNLLRELPAGSAAPDVERLGLLPALRHAVEQGYAQAFDEVRWRVEDGAAARLEALSPVSAGVVYYAAREAVRNAARHGRSPDAERPFILTVTLGQPPAAQRLLPGSDGELQLTIADNGRGFTSAPAGDSSGGQGLALHSTMLTIIGGALAVESVPGVETRVVVGVAV